MAKEQNQVVDRPTRALRDYVAPIFDENMSSILRMTLTANNFEIKLAFITMIQMPIQFGSHPSDDSHVHINNFMEI